MEYVPLEVRGGQRKKESWQAQMVNEIQNSTSLAHLILGRPSKILGGPRKLLQELGVAAPKEALDGSHRIGVEF